MNLVATFFRPGVSMQYLSLRILNILVRPFVLFAVAKLEGAEIGGAVAIAFAFAAWLMAPMSMGSYRWILPIEHRYDWNSSKCIPAIATYKLTVLASLICFPTIVFVIAFFLVGSVAGGLLAAFVVAYDFIIHEQSRRILYSGQLDGWARFLLYRNLILPAAWIAVLVGATFLPLMDGKVLIMPLIALSSGILMLASFADFYRKILILPADVGFFTYRGLFIKRVGRYWQYSVCGILAKSHQHADKILIAIIAPQYTWIISILSYFFNFPVMAYEMLNLARLKSTVIKLDAGQISARSKVDTNDLKIFVLGGVPAFVGAYLFGIYEGLGAHTLPLVLIYFVFSAFACIAMKRGELVFWAKINRWVPFGIDVIAGGATLLLIGLIYIIGSSFVFIKIPALCGIFIKLMLSKHVLQRKKND